MTYLFVPISQVDRVKSSTHTKGFRFKKCTLATVGTNDAYLNHQLGGIPKVSCFYSNVEILLHAQNYMHIVPYEPSAAHNYFILP
jgi:hypothetical protein